MAKALKIGALVVGVAALAVVTGGAAVGLGLSLGTTLIGTGISAGALLAASTALSLGATLLQKKPGVTAAQTERLTASIDPRAFRKTVLGQTAFPVDVRYEEWSGKDQEYCDWIICFASHAIDGLEEIWFNTEMAWSASTGVTAKFAGYFTLANLVIEGSPANAFSFGSGKWNGSARLTGCAYARFRFKVTGNGKKAESPFVSGPPSRMTIIGRGAKLYDPRRDSTVPGGNGPMRWNDQSTWRYTAADGATIGENLPLHILRVVLGWRIRNPSTGELRLATGSGVPGRRLNLASFAVAANLADELVNRSAGGQEPRYHGAAVVSEGDDPKTTLDMLSAACCARFRDTGGKLAIAIAHNDLAEAAIDDGLNDDDVIGGFAWDPDPSLDATPNVIRGRYVDATSASLYQLIDYPEIRIASPDGIDRVFTLDLGAVESPSHAQRIGKQVLQRKQYLREFTAPFDIRAWKYPVGAVVPFTFAPLGFTRALFRVKEQELGQDGACVMKLSVEHASIYSWDADDRAPVLAAEPIVYDSRNNPLILAIGEAATTAFWSGVVDDDGNRPEPNATVGAPLGTAIAGRPVEQVISDLDISLGNLLTEMLRNATYRGETDEVVYMADGTPVRTVIQVLSALVDGSVAYIADLRQVDGNGALKAAIVLNSQGKVTGVTQLNDGTTSSFYVVADEFGFIDPADADDPDAEPLRPLYYIDGVLYLDNVKVRQLDVDVVTTANIQSGQVTGLTSYGFPDAAISASETTIAEVTGLVIGDGTDGRALAMFSLTQDGSTTADTAARLRAYVDVGQGYVLMRTKLSGIRTSGADTKWSLPVSFPVSIMASGAVSVKLTAQGTGIAGGGNTSGSFARDVQIDIFSGAR